MILVDSSNAKTQYCASFSGKTEFVVISSGQTFIAIDKYSVVSYTMNVVFSSTANACSFNQCLNGGTCTVTGTTTFTCTCPTGFSGTTCQRSNLIVTSLECFWEFYSCF